MLYRFEFELSEADYIAFNRFYIENARVFKSRFFNNRWISGPVFLLLALFSFHTFSLTGTILTLIFAIFQLAVSVLCFWGFNRFVASFMLKGMMKKMKKDGKLPYGKENIVQFDEDFIIATEDEIESKFKYINIEKVVCDKHTVYIFVNAMQACTIPFSAFETEAQRHEFLMFLDRKVEAKGPPV